MCCLLPPLSLCVWCCKASASKIITGMQSYSCILKTGRKQLQNISNNNNISFGFMFNSDWSFSSVFFKADSLPETTHCVWASHMYMRLYYTLHTAWCCSEGKPVWHIDPLLTINRGCPTAPALYSPCSSVKLICLIFKGLYNVVEGKDSFWMFLYSLSGFTQV